MSYDVKKVDLTNVQSADQMLIPPGKRFSELAILDVPAGGQFWIKLGQSNPLIPITRGVTFEPSADDENNNGVYWQNDAAQAGTLVYITIAYGGQLNPVLI